VTRDRGTSSSHGLRRKGIVRGTATFPTLACCWGVSKKLRAVGASETDRANAAGVADGEAKQ
jgi:hypothetical protein